MSGWPQVPLGQVCKVLPGYAFKSKDWCADGMPVLKIKNIKGDGTISTSEADCVPNSLLNERMQRFIVQDGDMLLAMTGATAGKVGKLRSSRQFLLNQRVAKLTPFDIDSCLFWAVVSSNEYQDRFFRLADGAAQPNMSGAQIENVLIPLPPKIAQSRIGAILGAYDDLIEVNRRRMAVLEEMARGLFEEWFIRFRFPGYESVPIIETAQGPLPQGWTWGAFGNLAPEVRDTISPSEVPGDVPYVGLEHIPRRSTTLDDHGQASDATSLKARFRRGDILFGKIRPYFHKVAWAPFSGVASTDAIIWRPDPRFVAQTLAVASSDSFVAHAMQSSNGTKMPRANPKVLAAYRCALASAYISQQYEAVAAPMIEMAAGLQAANVRLAASRDLLLPKLISGRISVEAAQNELEQAA